MPYVYNSISNQVEETDQYFTGNSEVLLPHQYEYYSGRWQMVPRSEMILSNQLGPAINAGMYTRPSGLLRTLEKNQSGYLPMSAQNVMQNQGWVQWQAMQNAIAAQTAPALSALQNQIAVAQATQYNTGISANAAGVNYG